MSKKQEQLHTYIQKLMPGQRLSVRQLATSLHVSEGSAYRAIQRAKAEGLVASIPRVGTVRLGEEKTKKELLFSDIVPMIDGVVYSGQQFLDESLDQFMIGAMEEEVVQQYVRPHSLMIVGNRENVQLQALKSGAAVLITGGFPASRGICEASQYYHLPVIGTDYDTFTVATMINKALGAQEIMRSIVRITDVKTPLVQVAYLKTTDTIQHYIEKAKQYQQAVIPVVDHNMRTLGVVTPKEIEGKAKTQGIEKNMKKAFASVNNMTNIVSVAHLMIWDHYQVLPVIKENGVLDGLVSKEQIMQGLQGEKLPQKTPFDPLPFPLEEYFSDTKDLLFQFRVQAQMLQRNGLLAEGILSELMLRAARRQLQEEFIANDFSLEQLNLSIFHALSLGDVVRLKANLLAKQHGFVKIEVSAHFEEKLVAKAYLVGHMI